MEGNKKKKRRPSGNKKRKRRPSEKEGNKKKKRKTSVATQPEDMTIYPHVIHNFEYNIGVNNYTELVNSMREKLGEGQELVHDVPVMPHATPINLTTGKKYREYFRVKIFGIEGVRCALILRATDLYLIGFETNDSAMFEVRVNSSDKLELDASFCDLVGQNKPTKTDFLGTYPDLVEVSKIGSKGSIHIDYTDGLLSAVKEISSPTLNEEGKLDEKRAAKSLLSLVVIFCEAVKFKNIENTISKSIEQKCTSILLGNNLSEWVRRWGKLSKVIGRGDEGESETIKNWKLEDEEGKQIKTVEQAKDFVALLTAKWSEGG